LYANTHSNTHPYLNSNAYADSNIYTDFNANTYDTNTNANSY
jgi:hypothetical protein